MRSKGIISIIIFVLLGIFIFVQSNRNADRRIFDQFQIDQSQSAQKTVLWFPIITEVSHKKLKLPPAEIKKIIPFHASGVTTRTVHYEGGRSGYFVTGTIQLDDIGLYLQSYGGQIRGADWRNTSGVYDENTATWEVENMQFQARIIFRDDTFGMFVLQKYAQ